MKTMNWELEVEKRKDDIVQDIQDFLKIKAFSMRRPPGLASLLEKGFTNV